MRPWTFRNASVARFYLAPILTLLLLAGAPVPSPSGWAQPAIEPLVGNALRELRDKDPEVRRNAANNMGELSGAQQDKQVREQARQFGVPALIHALKDADVDVRQQSAFSLGVIHGDLQATVPALVEALRDTYADVRESAAKGLGLLGPDAQTAVPALIEALKDRDEAVAAEAANALGNIGVQPQLAVPALTKALKNDRSDVVRAAAHALIKYGREGRTSVSSLIELLNNSDDVHRFFAARVLAAIGPDAQAAVPALTNSLRDRDPAARLGAAGALAAIGQRQPEALSIAIRLLTDEDANIRALAAGVLGTFGKDAQPALPILTKALDDEDDNVRWVAAVALEKIAVAMREARHTDAIEPLTAAQIAMEKSSSRRVKARAPGVAEAVATLGTIRQHSVKERLLGAIRQQPRAAFAIGGYIAMALIWVALLWLWPISLFKINEALRPLPTVRGPAWLGGIDLSLSHLILVGFFNYRERVLDAWVVKNADKARAEFESSETVSKCIIPVQAPLLLDHKTLPALSVENLRPAFARTKTCVLIWGGNGDGRISLACQIARWAMEATPGNRLRKNLMLPILLEEDFVYKADKDTAPFTKTVRDKLQLAEVAVSQDAVAHLLKSKRLLVIIHGFSELSQDTQSMIQPSQADFPANALIVTSKVREGLGGVSKTEIGPVDGTS
jgi:HEAT repeat protein